MLSIRWTLRLPIASLMKMSRLFVSLCSARKSRHVLPGSLCISSLFMKGHRYTLTVWKRTSSKLASVSLQALMLQMMMSATLWIASRRRLKNKVIVIRWSLTGYSFPTIPGQRPCWPVAQHRMPRIRNRIHRMQGRRLRPSRAGGYPGVNRVVFLLEVDLIVSMEFNDVLNRRYSCRAFAAQGWSRRR